ncbi:HAD-IIA family hydrolase [Curvivirga sp.]|uniref:HAD-IIA family hydrolase n=1 Tax=Curvivirga sp. TaxID=2856848 RepID=UPI003B5A403B
MTPENIFSRYEEIRSRLPQMKTAVTSVSLSPKHVENLGQLTEAFDAFLFDAFGVLNVGEEPIESSVARFAELQALGKEMYILTNSASYQKQDLLTKFHRLGYNLSENNIVSSREILIEFLREKQSSIQEEISNIGVISICELSDFPENYKYQNYKDVGFKLSRPEEEAFWKADAYLFLSSAQWTEELQVKLLECLKKDPKPIYVGNPDIVAPRPGFFSLEPGYYAHQILDQTDAEVEFFGKPYDNTFSYAIARIREAYPDQSSDRILMLGDTLHTDILGGSAAGIKTALITDHGAFAGRDIQPYVAKSGIRPDFVIPTI